MLSLNTERDFITAVAQAVRERRLGLNLRQADLARKSGISLPTLRKLEKSGHVGLVPLAKVLTTLGMTDSIVTAMKRVAVPDQAKSMQDFISVDRPRGRKRARPPRTT